MKETTLAIAVSVLAMAGTAVYAQSAPAGSMTRAEATAKAVEMFTRMDVNKDGVINQADRDAHRTQMFDQMDTNKDGAISRDEFNSAHPARGPQGGEMGHQHQGGMDHDGHTGMGKPGGRMGHKMGGMGMMMMHMADTNKDGAVTRAEFDAALKQHLDKVDANKDGTISAEEHRAARAEMAKHMAKMRGGAQ